MSLASPEIGRREPSRVPRVLIVDDEADLRELFGMTLARLGLESDLAGSLAEARSYLQSRQYPLCLTDMRLPDGTGLDLVRELSASGHTRCIMITAYGSAENAVSALKAGAFDYLTKPVDLDQLRLLVRTALGENIGDHTAPASVEAALQQLAGDSPQMVQLRSMIRRLGHSMAPVAIIGESGSGKELVARAIHACSERRGGPFLAVNCGAIPENLMEAEFFGYRRGAFTGADRDRDGFFQSARGGTLLLDEVAELPLTMQVKLLRVIQERRVMKLGATTEEPIDVRILSATHQNLAQRVEAGTFRADLYYRLNVIELRVPSLRDRPQDIPELAARLLDRITARAATGASWLVAAAQKALQAWHFPGNVRELENVLERSVVMRGGGAIDADDLIFEASQAASLIVAEEPEQNTDASLGSVSAPSPGYRMVDGLPDKLEAFLDEREAEVLRSALEKTGNNRTEAAHLLGLSLRQMRYRMQRLGIR